MDVRSATARDYEDYLRLLPELQTGDPAPSLAAWTEKIAPDCVVIESGGAVIATAWFRIIGTWAHVVHVIVDPAWQGQGIGRRLMDVVAGRLRQAGCRSWYLNVKRENEAALRLYRSVGFRQHWETTALRLAWSAAEARLGGEPPASTRLALPEEDVQLESRWDLPPSTLAVARRRGELPVRLADSDRALAIFNPSFSGAWFFGVDHPSLLGPMLLALRTHAPDADRISLVVEGPALASLLREAGAELRFEMFHLRGEL